MYWVYILYSDSSDKFYIGYTSNLEGRLEAHNHEENSGWTRSYAPWRLVYSESFLSRRDAMSRERRLKSFKNKELIRKISQM